MSKKLSSSIVRNKLKRKLSNKRLLDIFKTQILVGGDQSIANCLAKKAKIIEHPGLREIMTQGASDDDIYFILSGSVSVKVNNREVAVRKAGEHIGEMALIDTSSRRSASICTLENSIFARVSEQEFTKIANRYPTMWRRIAVTIAQRLRERNKYQSVPRSEPAIFIGSSSEGLKVAECIRNYLSRYHVVPMLWTDGVFECSKTAIETLTNITKEVDFAIIVLTDDDITKSRKKFFTSPRDNAIFELGLFMGAISRERTYIIAPKGINIKIPTDLLGLTMLEYKRRGNISLHKRLTPTAKNIYNLIKKYGPI